MKNKLSIISIAAIFLLGFISNGQAQYSWTQKASMPGHSRSYGTAFSIGHYGFVGGGSDSTTRVFDFWKWNQHTNSWSAIANYPGVGSAGLVAFTINGKGYVGLGASSSIGNDLWEYDTTTNTWTQKANFPGTPRYACFTFVIGNNAYVGCGDPGSAPYLQDVWEYNSVTNTWRQRANFPILDAGMVGFAIGKNGYAGSGTTGTGTDYTNFYQYDTTSNTWTAIASLPYVGNGLDHDVAFVIGTMGFVGTGRNTGLIDTRQFWSYDTTTRSWSAIANLGGICRSQATSFSIGNYGYVVTGYDSLNSPIKDLWQYGNIASAPVASFSESDTLICVGDSVHFIDLSTNSPTSWKWTFENGNPASSTKQDTVVVYNTAGLDSVKLVVKNAGGSDSVTVKKCIHVIAKPSPVFSAADTVCKSDTTTIKVSGGSSYVWSNGATTSSIIVIPYTDSSFCVTVSNGICSKDTCIKIIVKNCSKLGIANILDNNNITIYPNPGNGMFNISINNCLIGNRHFEIYNTLGEQVYYTKVSATQFSINISNRPS